MSKKSPKKRYATSPSFSFYPHATFINGSDYMLERAQEKEEGSFYDLLTSMLFCAFSLESYLNYVGQEKLTSWKTIERKLNSDDKLRLICELVDYSPDMSKRPFQTFKDIFRFRNDVVHPKPETISRLGETIELKNEEFLEPQWMTKCNLTNAKRFLNDTEQILTELHSALDLEGHPYATSMIGTYWASTSGSTE